MVTRTEAVPGIPVPAGHLCGLTWLRGRLWFSEAARGRILAVDPGTGAVESTLDCPGVRTDLTSRDGLLIQVVDEPRVLRTIDPDTGVVVGESPAPRPGHKLCGLETGPHGSWYGYEDMRVVDRRDDDGRLVSSFPVSGAVAGLTVAGDHVLYADYQAGTVTVLDAVHGRELTVLSVPGNPTGLTWDGDLVWYCDYTTSHLRAVSLIG
jgi:sugar lactone lactonase YvrE